MLWFRLVRMYAAFARKTRIDKTATFAAKAELAVLGIRENLCVFHGCGGKGSGLSLRLAAGGYGILLPAAGTAVTAIPLGEPTILCSRKDESIIVGYYTSAEVQPRVSFPTQTISERRASLGQK